MCPLKTNQVICQESFEILFSTLLAMERGSVGKRRFPRMKEQVRAKKIVISLGDPLAGDFVHTGLFPSL